ncbi:hypothetical protein K461DRAFT_316393 [Myriangium duriaei CBS 260.36]|uniref:Secreted protein n=1 Tax=Myriangium duriaei CBS 260.36 TaxID=1168546 RepID=A0A9P4IWA2_9PEZI|nr:hypothetical protein K461DRAFT_316393 [Myriangium duriaei CBS 260.36]
MFNSKTLFVAFFLLVTNVLATKVTYYIVYKTSKGGVTSVSRDGEVPDDSVTAIIDNMRTWSGQKYKASMRHNSHGLEIVNISPARTKSETRGMFDQMESIIANNI